MSRFRTGFRQGFTLDAASNVAAGLVAGGVAGVWFRALPDDLIAVGLILIIAIMAIKAARGLLRRLIDQMDQWAYESPMFKREMERWDSRRRWGRMDPMLGTGDPQVCQGYGPYEGFCFHWAPANCPLCARCDKLREKRENRFVKVKRTK